MPRVSHPKAIESILAEIASTKTSEKENELQAIINAFKPSTKKDTINDSPISLSTSKEKPIHVKPAKATTKTPTKTRSKSTSH